MSPSPTSEADGSGMINQSGSTPLCRWVAATLLRGALTFAACTPLAYASSMAGLEIGAGRFGIAIYYNTVGEYQSGVDAVVRHPRGLLFDMARFVDTNHAVLSELDRQIRVDILHVEPGVGTDVALVSVTGANTQGEVQEIPAGEDIARRMYEVICAQLERGACILPRGEAPLALYRCRAENCVAPIRFGNIPADKDAAYSLRPHRNSGKPVWITRQRIAGLFKPIPP